MASTGITEQRLEAFETESVSSEEEHQPSVISNADKAKVYELIVVSEWLQGLQDFVDCFIVGHLCPRIRSFPHELAQLTLRVSIVDCLLKQGLSSISLTVPGLFRS